MATELARVRRSVPFKVDRNIIDSSPGIGFTMLQWVVSAEGEAPAYWSRARDKFLREFVINNGSLKTAVNTFVNKVVTIPFTIQAHDRSIARHVRSAGNIESSLRTFSGSMSTSAFRGFEEAFKMGIKDYLTQDNGCFWEVLGEGPADGPIVGAPTGLLHLDSALCTRTKDMEFPVKYLNAGFGGDNKEYKLHHSRVIEMANLPAAEVHLNGVGLCPVSCCIEAAQELWDIYRFSQEMFGSRPPNQILYAKKGATKKNLDDMILAWQMKMQEERRSRFGGTMVVAPRMSNQELELGIIKLSQMPENYNRRDITTINMSAIAAAFGLDLRDLAYTLGAPSRTGDAEVQDRKGRGKGVGEFIETFTKRFNEIYLNSDTHYIAFDYLDDEQDEQQALIRDKRSAARERDLRAGITTIRVEREMMLRSGEITRAEFEQMELQDGRLPEGLDVLLLFQSQDGEFKEWLNVGVSDPTNIKDNDPEKLSEAIHVKYIEVSTFVHEEANPLRRQKALQALAALDKLRSMYQVVEGQMLDEQAALEAQSDGMDQGAAASADPTRTPAAASRTPTQPAPAKKPAAAAQPAGTLTKERKKKPASTPVAEKQVSMIELDLEEYEQKFRSLVAYAVENEMPQHRFEEALGQAVTAVILALFLRGAKKQEGSLSLGEQVVVSMEIKRHLDAINGLSRDIYQNDRYDLPGTGINNAFERIDLWTNAASSAFFLGETFQASDPYLRWQVGLTEHCEDCLRLHGQVHRASEWRSANWIPRSWRLECTGIRCQCSFQDSNGPSSGGY